MRNFTPSFIVRRLKVKYPDIYNEILAGTKDFSFETINELLDSFCEVKKCTKADIAKNRNGFRTLFIALVLHTVDPNSVGDKTITGLNTTIAEVIGSSRKNVDVIVCSAKGLLRCHKPFREEVVRIAERINNAD